MKKLFLKSCLYGFLILLALELLVRTFHLTKDYPTRYIDDYGVEKWYPNQSGYSVTGIRRQNFSKYHINKFGYNSYREYSPTKEKSEVALVGDSFIEGFHQNYYNSIGKKIENKLKGVEVYEYGYAGYDLADQLHLINKYKEHFDMINYVVLGLKFENDLTRGEYNVVQDRILLESSTYKAMRQIKLLVYLKNIGALDAPKELAGKILNSKKNKEGVEVYTKKEQKSVNQKLNIEYLDNFKNLINIYGFDKTRFIFLLDSKKTPEMFLNYLKTNNYKYIDFYNALMKSKKPTTLIYDMHWNNHGRNIVASEVANYLNSKVEIN